jgi:hypothetical protein
MPTAKAKPTASTADDPLSDRRAGVTIQRVRDDHRTWKIEVAAVDSSPDAIRAAMALALELDEEMASAPIAARSAPPTPRTRA